MNWRLKILAKLVLSRLPVSYPAWRRLGVFKHGQMDKSGYAFSVVKRHFDQSGFLRRGRNFVAMEIGPGDSLLSSLVAHAYGASQTYLVDMGPFAKWDTGIFRELVDFLRGMNLPVKNCSEVASTESFMAAFNVHYLTEGLASLSHIPTGSVDFLWSHATLEHVRRAEFCPLIVETRRIIKDDGICSHRVDLKDHLGGSLNSLRFSELLWESDFFSKSGFYTNRFRFNEHLAIYEKARFKPQVIKTDEWVSLPTRKMKMNKAFREMPEELLRISGFDVLLQPS